MAATGTDAIVQAFNVQTLQNIAAALNDLSAAPKPNYSINGQSYSWMELFKELNEMQERVRKNIQNDEGAWEVVNYGRW